MHADLFPETLIVTLQHGQPMTSSKLIADHFGKQHKNVLKAIRTVLDRTVDADRRLNFEPTMGRVPGPKGATRQEPMYLLTRKGFQFIVSGFTGAEADEWKWRFFDAFEAMESELHRLQGAKASALDMLRPNLQAIIDGERIGANRALVARYLGKSMGAVSYHRCVARRLGLIGQRQGGAA